jgi:hypothetical protein
VCKNAEAGQAVGESAGDSVRDSQIERRYPPFAEPDQEDWCDEEHQKRNQYGNYHGQVPFITCVTTLAIRNLGGRRLLQLRVLRFGFLQDWDVGVGVFPDGEEAVTAASPYV